MNSPLNGTIDDHGLRHNQSNGGPIDNQHDNYDTITSPNTENHQTNYNKAIVNKPKKDNMSVMNNGITSNNQHSNVGMNSQLENTSGGQFLVIMDQQSHQMSKSPSENLLIIE